MQSIFPERSSEDRIQGYGNMRARWLGDPGRPTGYELHVDKGRNGPRIAVTLDVVIGASMAPGFQLRSVSGTSDTDLIARMVHGGVNTIAMDDARQARALRSRIDTDLARLVDIRDGLAETECADAGTQARREQSLEIRIRRLETLKASVDGWFASPDGQGFQQAWIDGGGSRTDVINLGTIGIPEFIASAQRDSLRRLFSDQGAPANEIRAMAIGADNEIADIAVAVAHAHGIEGIHYVSEDYAPSRPEARAPFVHSLAGTPPVTTPELADLVREGTISSEDLVVVDCPEPREFHLDRLTSTLEELGLDVPVLAFNRSFAVMARTGALRRYVEDQMAEAGISVDDPEQAAGMAP
jgi:hypothetical protein